MFWFHRFRSPVVPFASAKPRVPFHGSEPCDQLVKREAQVSGAQPPWQFLVVWWVVLPGFKIRKPILNHYDPLSRTNSQWVLGPQQQAATSSSTSTLARQMPSNAFSASPTALAYPAWARCQRKWNRPICVPFCLVGGGGAQLNNDPTTKNWSHSFLSRSAASFICVSSVCSKHFCKD